MELAASVAGGSAIPIMAGIFYLIASFTFATQPFVPKQHTYQVHILSSEFVVV
jgi:hypothetical protein